MARERGHDPGDDECRIDERQGDPRVRANERRTFIGSPRTSPTARTAAENGGQTSSAHGPKTRSVRATSARSATGSTHRNVPTHRNGRTSQGCCPRPSSAAACRRELQAETPVARSKRPTPGTTPGSPGNGTVVAARSAAEMSVGRRHSRRTRTRSARDPSRPCDGRSSSGPGHPEWPEDQRAERRLERRAGPLPDQRARARRSRGSSRSGAAGRGERRRALERQPRRVGQQVPHGRSRRTGRFVEVDLAALHGDQHGQRGDRLCDRRPAVRVTRSPRLATIPSGPTSAAAAWSAPQASIARARLAGSVMAKLPGGRPGRRARPGPVRPLASAAEEGLLVCDHRTCAARSRRAPTVLVTLLLASTATAARRRRSSPRARRATTATPSCRRRRRRGRRPPRHREGLLDRQELPGPPDLGRQDLGPRHGR